MSPKLVSAATIVGALATSLEASHVLPPGVATAIGTVLTFILGLFHAVPGGK